MTETDNAVRCVKNETSRNLVYISTLSPEPLKPPMDLSGHSPATTIGFGAVRAWLTADTDRKRLPKASVHILSVHSGCSYNHYTPYFNRI